LLQKKKRTHREAAVNPTKKGVPKSFVWAHGSKRALVRELCADMKAVMQPHTAAHLKVSQRNVLKDFVHVAGPLGVSHFVILTATEKASYLKLCKCPRVRAQPYIALPSSCICSVALHIWT
jgi:ribosome biogenesis protein SSF1/2